VPTTILMVLQPVTHASAAAITTSDTPRRQFVSYLPNDLFIACSLLAAGVHRRSEANDIGRPQTASFRTDRFFVEEFFRTSGRRA
jgi:hypothetical protein